MNTTLQTERAQDIRPAELPVGIPALVWFAGLLILCYIPILYSLVDDR
jgi:hypothetical protein